MPNVSGDKPNIQRNAELIQKMLAARGVSAKLASVPGGNPVVIGTNYNAGNGTGRIWGTGTDKRLKFPE